MDMEPRRARGSSYAGKNAAGGGILIALSAIVLFLTSDLDFGSLSGIGPGFLPRLLAGLIGIMGLGMVFSSTRSGDGLQADEIIGAVVPVVLMTTGLLISNAADVSYLAACAVLFLILSPVVLAFPVRYLKINVSKVRGPFLLTAALIAFAATVRAPGLSVATALLSFIGGMASTDFRWRELLLFTIALTALSVLIFKVGFGLAVPTLHIPGIVRI